MHTDVQDSLLDGVLARVPVLPVLQLLISALVFAKDNHDHALMCRREDRAETSQYGEDHTGWMVPRQIS